MRGVIVHGVLLVVMLGFAYQTWTRDKTVHVSTGDVAVWDQSVSDLTAVEYQTTKADPATPTKSTERTVRLEKRSDANGEYWWGIETRSDQKPKKAPAAAGSAAGSDDTEAVTTKREFPVGQSFRVAGSATPMQLADLMKTYAAMRAVRSLGTLTEDQKKDFDLAAGGTTLAVIFKGKTRTLILGGKVSGSAERYAMDPDGNKGYILAGAIVDPIETGESMLKPQTIHGYESEALDAATVKAGTRSKSASRITVTGEHGESTRTWGDAATKKGDQTFANFVDNLDRLAPQKFDPSRKASEMTEVVTVTYTGAGGKKIGALGLYKIERPGEMPEDGSVDPTLPPPPVVEYYVLTEATRVPAMVAKAQAERVEQDVPTLFGEDSGSGTGTGTGTGSAAGSGSAASAGSGSGQVKPVTQ